MKRKGNNSYSIINIFNGVGGTLKGLLDFIDNLKMHENFLTTFCTIDNHDYSVYLRNIKAKRVFSPFNYKEVYKPLKATPKKWHLSHAIRAILNGQIEYLKCNGIYTDDYLFDNAYNYGKGMVADNLDFVKGLIEHPNGWDSEFIAPLKFKL